MNAPEGFYTIEQTAKVLNRTPKMIDIYVRKGLLTKFRVLGQTLYKKDDVDKLATPEPVNQSV